MKLTKEQISEAMRQIGSIGGKKGSARLTHDQRHARAVKAGEANRRRILRLKKKLS